MEKQFQDTAERLGIPHNPKLQQKAEQLYTQLSVNCKTGALVRHQNAKVAVCLQLACEQEQIKFNKSGAIQVSATTERVYQECVNQARSISPVEVTFENLAIRFGCEHAKPLAREVYDLFTRSVPPTVKIDIRAPHWNAAIFEIVCKELKVSIKKAELAEMAAVDTRRFNKNVQYIREVVGPSLSELLSKSTATTTPSKGARTPRKRKLSSAAVDVVIGTPRTKESIEEEEEDGEVRSSKRLKTPARQTAQQTPTRKSMRTSPRQKGKIGQDVSDHDLQMDSPTQQAIRTSPRNKGKDGQGISDSNTQSCSTPVHNFSKAKGKLPRCDTAAITTATTSTIATAKPNQMNSMIPFLPYQQTRKYKEYQAWRAQYFEKCAIV